MKNTKQIVEFTANGILWKVIPKELSEDVKVLIDLEHGLKPDLVEAVAKRKDLLAKLPESAIAALRTYGVESPSDIVKVVLEMGSFLFDLAVHGSQKPSSPMGMRIYEREMTNLANTLSVAEFSLPAAVQASVRRVLENEHLWKSLEVTAYVEVNDEKVTFPMKSIGLYFYKTTLNSILDEFEKND